MWNRCRGRGGGGAFQGHVVGGGGNHPGRCERRGLGARTPASDRVGGERLGQCRILKQTHD